MIDHRGGLAVLPRLLAVVVRSILLMPRLLVMVAVLAITVVMAVPIAITIAVPILLTVVMAMAILTAIILALVIARLIVAILRELALAFGLLTLSFAQKAGVMLGMLKKRLLCHPVIRQLRVTRQCQVFFNDLLGGAAHLALWSRGIKDTVNNIAERTLTVRLRTRTGFR